MSVSTPPHLTAQEEEGGGGGGGGGGGVVDKEVWMYGGEGPSDEAAQHVAANELRGE